MNVTTQFAQVIVWFVLLCLYILSASICIIYSNFKTKANSYQSRTLYIFLEIYLLHPNEVARDIWWMEANRQNFVLRNVFQPLFLMRVFFHRFCDCLFVFVFAFAFAFALRLRLRLRLRLLLSVCLSVCLAVCLAGWLAGWLAGRPGPAGRPASNREW